MALITIPHNCNPTKTQFATAAADHIDSQPLPMPVADDTYWWVVVAKAAELAPYAHTSVLETNRGSDMVVSKPINERACHTSVWLARVIVEIAPSKSVHVLLTNMSDKLVHIPKRKIVAHLTDSPAGIVATETALLETNPQTVGAVQYKLLIHRDTQMTRLKDVEPKDGQKFKLDWKSKFQPSDEYAKNCY